MIIKHLLCLAFLDNWIGVLCNLTFYYTELFMEHWFLSRIALERKLFFYLFLSKRYCQWSYTGSIASFE